MNSEDANLEDDSEDEDQTAGLQGVAPWLGGLGSSAISLSVLAGGTSPWVAALTAAFASPSIMLAAQTVLRRQEAKVQIAFDVACESGECTFDELIHATATSDRKLELLSNMMSGAARSESEAHVRALGRLLADGAFADFSEDAEFARIMTALSQLDGADVEFLAHVGRIPSGSDGPANFFVRSPGDASSTVAGQLPNLAPVLDSIVARMSTLGIISSAVGEVSWGGISSSTSWHITQFGGMCVGRLLAEGLAAPDSEGRASAGG